MNISIEKNRIDSSKVIIDSVFGKYPINNIFVNWYLNNEYNIKDLFLEVIEISHLNGIYIENNDEIFNSFLIMTYNESHNLE
jgi:hypothetical protein